MSQEHLLEPPELRIPVREGVEMRLLTAQDTQLVLEVVQGSQKHMAPWVKWAEDGELSEKTIRDMLEKNDVGFAEGTAYGMGIFVEDKLAGSVDIRDIGSEQGAEIGYWLSEEFVGQGLVTQSAEVLIEYARSKHNIPKINLNTYVGNGKSANVAARLSFGKPVVRELDDGSKELHFEKVYDQAG